VLMWDRLTEVEVPAGKLQIRVNNLGRGNNRQVLLDGKSLKEVRLNGRVLTGWMVRGLPLSGAEGVMCTTGNSSSEPAFSHGAFEVDAIVDTFWTPRAWPAASRS